MDTHIAYQISEDTPPFTNPLSLSPPHSSPPQSSNPSTNVQAQPSTQPSTQLVQLPPAQAQLPIQTPSQLPLSPLASPTQPPQPNQPQQASRNPHSYHRNGRFKQVKTTPKVEEPALELYPQGIPMPYEYKAKEWQKKTPKMVVIEYFQRYQIKDNLKWERINLPFSKKHLVKCIFPIEFGSKEFVPNRTWNSVKDAEHNTAILALIYLNSVPEGSGNQDVVVPPSDFIPPPLPMSDPSRKQMAFLKYRKQIAGKRRTPDSEFEENPNRIGVGQYSAVPPPEQFQQAKRTATMQAPSYTATASTITLSQQSRNTPSQNNQPSTSSAHAYPTSDVSTLYAQSSRASLFPKNSNPTPNESSSTPSSSSTTTSSYSNFPQQHNMYAYASFSNPSTYQQAYNQSQQGTYPSQPNYTAYNPQGNYSSVPTYNQPAYAASYGPTYTGPQQIPTTAQYYTGTHVSTVGYGFTQPSAPSQLSQLSQLSQPSQPVQVAAQAQPSQAGMQSYGYYNYNPLLPQFSGKR